MIKSLAIFIGVGLALYLIVKWLVKSEKNNFEEQQWLDEYGSSPKFQAFYAEKSYQKLSRVIESFEQAHPEEMHRLKEENDKKQSALLQSKEKYDTLVFEYQDELQRLKATGAKRFMRQEVLEVFDNKELEALLASHVINFYSNQYLLQEKYEAEHPNKVDEHGLPLKIKF